MCLKFASCSILQSLDPKHNSFLLTNMVRTEYSAVRKAEVRGIFVSLFNMFLVLFLLLSLVIALIVVAALLVHEKGKEYAGGIDGDPKKSGKRTLCEVYCIVI